ncbi:MAG: tetratricopeptide repeat protein [Myxococcales bacterium]|nr:tetratricopeptide repeat protein [Myxococcales bacterium]
MRTAALAGLFGVILSAGPARADLATGAEQLARGDYKAAIGELSRTRGADAGNARLLQVDAQLAIGDVKGAEATATAASKDANAVVATNGKVALADVLRATGRVAEAQKLLEAVVAADPGHRPARRALARLLTATGKLAEADALWKRTIDEYDAKLLDLDKAADLFALGEAARARGEFELANDAYREAVNLAPTSTEAGLAWADLFRSKYSGEVAEQTYDEVLKINPHQPDAHAGMAAVLLENRYDLAQARHHLAEALAVNPRHLPSLLVRASIEIDQNQWDAAGKTLAEVRAVNPQSLEALALEATIAWLRDDTKAYDAAKAKAFAINPADADLYQTVARSAVREHRYREAIELSKQAVALRPDAYDAMSEVGMGYLRLGEEQEGVAWLNKAWAGDKYNVRTYNTRNLFNDTIPSDYTFSSSKSFKFRYHKGEQKILSRYIEPTLERAFADMVKRYGFTPKTPVVVELYQDSDHYSVRTVGLPNLGALGVCFGQVITAMSPSNGDINWGMVLWHELGHVFAIQLSNSRVPRWFTEGLSEYETLIANPSWRRENDADVYGAVLEGTLPSVATINYEFVQPDAQKVVVAYYLSSVMIEYIASTYGFPKIVAALKLFGKGQETPAVVQAITGRTVAEFDQDFRAYLKVRLAPYQGTFRLPTAGLDDVTALAIAADAKPKDALVRARLALGHFYQGDADPAETAATAALKLDKKQPIARYILAEIALRKGDEPGGKALIEGLIADGHDSYDLRIRLSELAVTDGDLAGAIAQLCAAKRLDPERSYPYMALAEIYKKQQQADLALTELEHYVMLEQMQLAPLRELVDAYATRGAWPKVKTYGEMALAIYPADPDLLLSLGKAYLALGDGAAALSSYDSALVIDPPIRRPALAHLGRTRAYLALGDKAKARAALALAARTEPAHAEVIELKKLVR